MEELKASELRIGNLVEHSIDLRKTWWQIKEIDADDIKYLSETPDCEYYRPLQLSTDLMLKFGFTHSSDEKFYYRSIFVVCTDGYGRYKAIGDAIIWKPIKYAHELQNKCFSNTGHELTIKQEDGK